MGPITTQDLRVCCVSVHGNCWQDTLECQAALWAQQEGALGIIEVDFCCASDTGL